jgi:homocysteine S-methyltransferase
LKVLDGGFSTALEKLGNTLNTSLWSGELLKSHPDQIRAAHKLFVESGAEILITSSYQITFPGCEALGWSKNQIDKAIADSTELARFPGVKVAASVGPYGAYLADGSEYQGNYGLTKNELKEFHRDRLIALINTKPDLLAIETIPELTEAEAIIELVHEIAPEMTFWMSFSCRSGSELSSGEIFADAVRLVNSSSSAIAVGINCTNPVYVADLLRSAFSQIPFVVYPNSGRTWDADKKQWLGPETSSFEESDIRLWESLGAGIIGGCCGVSPEDISALSVLLRD